MRALTTQPPSPDRKVALGARVDAAGWLCALPPPRSQTSRHGVCGCAAALDMTQAAHTAPWEVVGCAARPGGCRSRAAVAAGAAGGRGTRGRPLQALAPCARRRRAEALPGCQVAERPRQCAAATLPRCERHLRRRAGPVAAALAEGGEAWWELGSDLPNELAVHSTAELLAALSAANEKLVVVHFYAQWCAACKALHPKLVQIIGSRSDVQFVKVEFDTNKAMSRSLGVKVLPFFQLYRGSTGRVAEFSASLSKVQRLRDALDEHGGPRCVLGPPVPPALPKELLS